MGDLEFDVFLRIDKKAEQTRLFRPELSVEHQAAIREETAFLLNALGLMVFVVMAAEEEIRDLTRYYSIRHAPGLRA